MIILAVLAQASDALTFAGVVALQGGTAGELNPLVHAGGPGPALLIKALAMVAIAAYGYRRGRWARPVLMLLAGLGALGALANSVFLAGL